MISSCLLEYLSRPRANLRNCVKEFRIANMVPFSKSVKNGSRNKEWNQSRDSGYLSGRLRKFVCCVFVADGLYVCACVS